MTSDLETERIHILPSQECISGSAALLLEFRCGKNSEDLVQKLWPWVSACHDAEGLLAHLMYLELISSLI